MARVDEAALARLYALAKEEEKAMAADRDRAVGEALRRVQARTGKKSDGQRPADPEGAARAAGTGDESTAGGD